MGNTVYVGSCSGTFYALNRETGEVRWSYDTKPDGGPNSFHGDALQTEDLIVIGTDGGKQAHVYAFEQMSGKVRWKYTVTTPAEDGSGISTDIVRDGNTLLATAQGDELLSLDLLTGRVRWTFSSKFDRSLPTWSNSPALDGKHVLFAGQDGVVYALEADSGKLVWERNVGASLTTSPALFNGTAYVGTRDGTFYRVRASDGGLLGSLKMYRKPWRSVATHGNDLVIQAEELTCLDMRSNQVRWAVKPPVGAEWMTARPYVWRNYVLAGDDKGHLLAYRLGDGALAWSHEFPGQKIRGIGVTEEFLYAGSITGMVYAFHPPKE